MLPELTYFKNPDEIIHYFLCLFSFIILQQMLADIFLQMHEAFVFLLLQNNTGYLVLNIKSGSKIFMKNQVIWVFGVFVCLFVCFNRNFQFSSFCLFHINFIFCCCFLIFCTGRSIRCLFSSPCKGSYKFQSFYLNTYYHL